LNTPTPELAAAQEKWEHDIKAAEPQWTVLRPSSYVSKGGAKLTLLPDGSLLAGGKNPDADAYDVTVRTDLTGITGVRLEVMNDPSLPATGPGRTPDGNFFLTDFEAEAAPAAESADAQKIRFKQAAADDSQRDSGDEDAAGYSFNNLVNDKPQPKGWSIQPTTDKSLVVRRGVLVPEKPFGFADCDRPVPDFRYHDGRSAPSDDGSGAVAHGARSSPCAAHRNPAERSCRRLPRHRAFSATHEGQDRGNQERG
jgi:hypothetical protein